MGKYTWRSLLNKKWPKDLARKDRAVCEMLGRPLPGDGWQVRAVKAWRRRPSKGRRALRNGRGHPWPTSLNSPLCPQLPRWAKHLSNVCGCHLNDTTSYQTFDLMFVSDLPSLFAPSPPHHTALKMWSCLRSQLGFLSHFGVCRAVETDRAEIHTVEGSHAWFQRKLTY